MRLFVTGATGFIGSHFLNLAMSTGHDCVALRRSPSSKPRIELWQEPRWIDCGMDAIKTDDLANIDALVHLAAHTPNVPYDTIENCLQWNVTVPLALFRKAHQAGVERFVVAGSCFEYGAAAERYEFIPANAPLEAKASYPLSKAVASRVFASFAAETNTRVSVHRIFQVFGPGESDGRFWPSLHRAAIEGSDFDMSLGEQVRDFIRVEEVAQQLCDACAWTDITAGNAYFGHIGSGQPQTLRQFAEYWWHAWKASGKLNFGAVPYRETDVMRYVPEVNDSFVVP